MISFDEIEGKTVKLRGIDVKKGKLFIEYEGILYKFYIDEDGFIDFDVAGDEELIEGNEAIDVKVKEANFLFVKLEYRGKILEMYYTEDDFGPFIVRSINFDVIEGDK